MYLIDVKHICKISLILKTNVFKRWQLTTFKVFLSHFMTYLSSILCTQGDFKCHHTAESAADVPTKTQSVSKQVSFLTYCTD